MAISLDELSRAPEQAAKLPANQRREVSLRCAALITAVASADEPEVSQRPAEEPDRLISLKEVAARLDISPSWARQQHYPFRIAGTRKYSAQGLELWIRRRRGA
jgi:hypothetical protein